MNTGKILIANFSKGELGEDVSSILGNMLVTNIQLAALYRTKQPENDRKPFYLYVDEMQSFVSLSFADILAEARKYRLSLFLSHQYIDQLHEKIRSAIFGNVGTIISFRIGAEDAKVIAKEFTPIFGEDDLLNLSKYHMYLKLMIDGASSKPFSAVTLPTDAWFCENKDEILRISKQTYGRAKKTVEQSILESYKKDTGRLIQKLL